MNVPRSGCPINLTLEALGDRWSLIVIRDLMLGNRRHFRELLTPLGGADSLEHSGRPADALMRLRQHTTRSRRLVANAVQKRRKNKPISARPGTLVISHRKHAIEFFITPMPSRNLMGNKHLHEKTSNQ